ncbi:hypothetical protein V202x_05390 [Gimesia aquarii]|uniref:Uncharacterized protein n=1 Tax=Gimesia aquarii TaxID=2527964 RepID=A0A517WPM3_9PLAN|nr:hypothetical protein V202x_05390 [Gimesia aquarii]
MFNSSLILLQDHFKKMSSLNQDKYTASLLNPYLYYWGPVQTPS